MAWPFILKLVRCSSLTARKSEHLYSLKGLMLFYDRRCQRDLQEGFCQAPGSIRLFLS